MNLRRGFSGQSDEILKLLSFYGPFQDEPYSVKLLGRAWQNIVYMRGWDELMPCAESLRAEVDEEEEEGLGSKHN